MTDKEMLLKIFRNTSYDLIIYDNEKTIELETESNETIVFKFDEKDNILTIWG